MKNNIQRIPIDLIEPDITNPRITNYLDYYKDKENINLDQMRQALGADEPQVSSDGTPSYESLKESIKTRGGIIQPIIVNKHSDGQMTVIEGNTRLVIYKEFKDEGVQGDWDEIPAVVYEDADPEFLDSIRLQAHLVGARPWDPYSKAKYLTKLSNEGFPISDLVSYCGGKKKEVQLYLQGYKDMENFYRPLCKQPYEFKKRHFSAFVELQDSRVKKVMSDFGMEKDTFAKLVFEDKFSPLNTIRSLPAILKNEQATKILFKDGAKEAKKIVDLPPDPKLNEFSDLQIAEELARRIDNFSIEVYKKLSEDNSKLRDNLEYIHETVPEILSNADRLRD